MRNLAVACKLAVHPYIETGIHTLKMEISALLALLLTEQEIRAVGSARILLRDIGGIIGEGVVYIGILVPIITKHLPAARHGNGVKGRIVKIRIHEMIRHLKAIGVVMESPLAAQQRHALRQLTIPQPCQALVPEGNKIGMIGLRSNMQSGRILIVARQFHKDRNLLYQ